MQTIIHALALISRLYSETRKRSNGRANAVECERLVTQTVARLTLFPGHVAPPTSAEVDGLILILEKQREKMAHAFVMEIRQVQKEEAEVRRRREAEERDRRLREAEEHLKEKERREREEEYQRRRDLEESERRKRKEEDQQKRDLEMRGRREREEREKDEGKARQKQMEDEATLKQLLSSNNSSYLGKSECIAETRVSILGELKVWAESSALGEDRLFWLYGVAGCGKSAVAASISRELDNRDRPFGSFFCKREEEDRRAPRHLLGHLAYFLAKGYSVFKKTLIKALRDPEFLVIKDDQAYFEFVIKKPLSTSKSRQGSSETSLVIVIDALDECNDSELAARCLAYICDTASWVKIIVTSRDLPEIRGPLEKCSHRRAHSLFDDDALDDIRRLLDKELEPEGRLARMCWFIKERREAFVEFSQGLFIWLDTIITFIANEGNLDAVEKVLVDALRPEAEASLDILYRAVIKNAAEKTKASRTTVPLIIGFVVASSSTQPLTPRVIHALLPPSLLVTLEDVELSLAHLGAILVSRDHGIEAAHTSILDFGADKERCGEDIWYPPVYIQQVMATGCLEIMIYGTRNSKRQHQVPAGLCFNICDLRSSYFKNSEVMALDQRVASNVSSELVYSSLYWTKHLVNYLLITETLEKNASRDLDTWKVSQMVADFLPTERSLFWLEVLSLTGELGRVDDVLIDISEYSQLEVSFCLSNLASSTHKCHFCRYSARSHNSLLKFATLWGSAMTLYRPAHLTFIFV